MRRFDLFQQILVTHVCAFKKILNACTHTHLGLQKVSHDFEHCNISLSREVKCHSEKSNVTGSWYNVSPVCLLSARTIKQQKWQESATISWLWTHLVNSWWIHPGTGPWLWPDTVSWSIATLNKLCQTFCKGVLANIRPIHLPALSGVSLASEADTHQSLPTWLPLHTCSFDKWHRT